MWSKKLNDHWEHDGRLVKHLVKLLPINCLILKVIAIMHLYKQSGTKQLCSLLVRLIGIMLKFARKHTEWTVYGRGVMTWDCFCWSVYGFYGYVNGFLLP